MASAMVEMFTKANMTEYVGPFAGQVAGLITEIKPTAEILMDMVGETVDILTTKLPENVSAKM